MGCCRVVVSRAARCSRDVLVQIGTRCHSGGLFCPPYESELELLHRERLRRFTLRHGGLLVSPGCRWPDWLAEAQHVLFYGSSNDLGI